MSIKSRKMPFIKKIKLRIFFGFVIAAIGAGTFALALPNNPAAQTFMSGFYVGTGGGLFGAGLVTAIKNLMYLKNKERFKKQELKETDERNVFVAARSAQFAFYIGIYGLYLATVITGLFNAAAATVLLWVLGALFLIWLVAYTVCNKFY
ncbi:hypothetical protein EDD70_0013 [Hydrogenoanaerobacterium saccharovorans]|uniref:DUF2178 domain-containing protein n=1 Tax=Hydrogenoanaerobacterium saccharovorans TaxID=474960 RepID=A0A1H8BT08_9FIRM|nr:hypothetical protein [Hydrogenoanaerobacterium saccharovorans]RPF47246.1 hypothetical protein EDD70_0013 [Hydrogenoanaerobacterium saccharovorans]SEM86010.1 hypothetical protein SAMN05216180_2082 [Hydrogenoanaerobacterium saccharovorans]